MKKEYMSPSFEKFLPNYCLDTPSGIVDKDSFGGNNGEAEDILG